MCALFSGKLRFATAFTGFVLLAVLVLGFQPAYAAELQTSSVNVQSSAANISFSNAKELALGQSFQGVVDPNDEYFSKAYWYKFKTSKRNSTYTFFYDSLNAKDFHIKFYDGAGSGVQWQNTGAWGGIQYATITHSPSTFIKRGAGKGSWYYVSLERGVGSPAGPGDGFRLKFDEHPNIKVVTGIKAFKVAKRSVKLKWNKQTNATKYQIRYKAKGGSWKTATATKNSVKLKKLKKGATYQVKVCAYCKKGWNLNKDKQSNWSSWSTVKTFKTKR